MKPPPLTFQRLEHQKILLVDGNDELNFYSALLRREGLCNGSDRQIYQPIESEGIIQTRDCGNVMILSADGNIVELLSNLKAYSGFSEVKVIGIITDAEASARNRLISIQGALGRAGLPWVSAPLEWVNGPPKIGLLVQPPNRESGMLEDMCIQSITGQAILSCIDEFLKCVTKGQVQKISQLAKAKIRCFLATRDDPDKSMGVAASADYWDFNAPVWGPVKTFLSELCSDRS